MDLDNKGTEPLAPIRHEMSHEMFELMSVASNFEHGFSIDWILDLTGIKASVGLRIMDQAVAEKVLEKSNPGIYFFIDQDYRKKLYSHLLPHQIKDLTQRVVPLYLLETPNDKRITAQIVHHLLQLKKDLTGYQWLFKAGLFYKRRFKWADAKVCFSNILDGLKPLQGVGVDRLFVKSAIEYSKCVDISEQAPSAYPVLKDALERSRKMKDDISTATVEIHLSSVQWFRKKHNDAYRRYEIACAMAADISDTSWQRSFSVFKVMQSYLWGEYKNAVADFGKTSPDVAKHPKAWLLLRGGYFLGTCLAATGEITQGLGMIYAIRDHCRKMGNLSIATEAGIQLVNILIDIRQIDKAFEHIKEIMEDAARLDNKYLITHLTCQLAYIYYLKQEYETSVKYMEQYREMKEDGMDRLPLHAYELILSWAMLENVLPKVDGFDFQEQLAMYLKSMNKSIKGVALRFQARYEIKAGKPVKEGSGNSG